jgi:hypothetical protein
VIVMTTSQHAGRAEAVSPVRHALDGSLGALRHLNDEQIIFWECFWRSARAPQPRTQVSSPAFGCDAKADSGSLLPAGAGRGDQSA